MVFRVMTERLRRCLPPKMRSPGCFGGFLAGIVGGLFGVGAVLVGTVLEIPGFSLPRGHWGTQFLSSVLYQIGSDATGITIVCCFWFMYGALSFGVTGWAIFAVLSRRSSQDSVPLDSE